MEAINNFLDVLPAWVDALLGLSVAATAITALTRTNQDNRVLDIISRVLNVLAGNIGKNRNADDRS